MVYCRWHIADGKKILGLLVVSFFLLISLSGCATLKEWGKGVVGVSTKVLEEGRQEAITKTFNCGYFTCYAKTKEVLNEIGAQIYAQNIKKRMIAVYVSQEDTTPVGLFFEELDKDKTLVEVTSPSTYSKEQISGLVFRLLEESL